jgi:hypothetical protein
VPLLTGWKPWICHPFLCHLSILGYSPDHDRASNTRALGASPPLPRSPYKWWPCSPFWFCLLWFSCAEIDITLLRPLFLLDFFALPCESEKGEEPWVAVKEEVTRATPVAPFCLYRPVPNLSSKNPSSYFGSLYADACWLLVLVLIFLWGTLYPWDPPILWRGHGMSSYLSGLLWLCGLFGDSWVELIGTDTGLIRSYGVVLCCLSILLFAGTIACVLLVLFASVTGTTPITGTLLMLVLCWFGWYGLNYCCYVRSCLGWPVMPDMYWYSLLRWFGVTLCTCTYSDFLYYDGFVWLYQLLVQPWACVVPLPTWCVACCCLCYLLIFLLWLKCVSLLFWAVLVVA